ncbi:sporulation protein [Mesobacillus campisalis]|uniref:Sporulation protein n=1 Tax=Mesobacillus campisalis TaxID=1408103 RepID=A0A0M2SX44_9BACI|nr:GerMN domain-containing protein [Mesobacillus campisalis]KKK38286.1 sporulation protein [Mesobacillus campisalis]
MSKNKKVTLVTAATLATTVFLSGCGLFGGEEKKKIDPPQDATYLDESEAGTVEESAGAEAKGGEMEEAVEGNVQTELYLIDKNGYVVSQTMSLPKSEGVAKQALDHLVENGPVTEMLPNGFRAVLPADTQMSVNIKDGVATVDFSKEFANYKKEDELKILQAVTWTLTQFDSVDKVKLQMNGEELKAMPVNGTPIAEELSRSQGINHDLDGVVDISNTKSVTVYYLGGDEDSYYYVPVTKRVDNDGGNDIQSIVSALAAGPGYGKGLLSEFQAGVKLNEDPKVEEGKVTLDFNEAIYGSFEEKIVSEHVLNSLVLSLTEQKGVESVAVTVNGKAELVTESGQKLSEPVTRPEKVNTGSF